MEISEFLKLMKVPVRVIIGACVVNGFVLYCPDSLLNGLGLLNYREKHRSTFGMLLLILVAVIISYIVGVVVETVQNRGLLRALQKRLHNLTMAEMQILGPYFAMKTKTRYLSVQDGVVKGLTDEGIIYRSSNISSPEYGVMAFAHNIQPWAWDYLNEHPEVFEQQLKKLVGK